MTDKSNTPQKATPFFLITMTHRNPVPDPDQFSDFRPNSLPPHNPTTPSPTCLLPPSAASRGSRCLLTSQRSSGTRRRPSGPLGALRDVQPPREGRPGTCNSSPRPQWCDNGLPPRVLGLMKILVLFFAFLILKCFTFR